MNKIAAKFAFLKSRTMRWFGIYLPIAPVALDQLKDQMPQLQPYIPDNIYKATFVIAIVAGLILRAMTTGPLPKASDVADK